MRTRNPKRQLRSASETTPDTECEALFSDEPQATMITPTDMVGMAEKLVETFESKASTTLHMFGEALGQIEGARFVQSRGKTSSSQRVTQLKKCFEDAHDCGFGRCELIDFDENNEEVDVVLRLRLPEKQVDEKSLEFFRIFLEGFYKGLMSMALDRIVTSETRGCAYDANCCEFTLRAKLPSNADRERMELQ